MATKVYDSPTTNIFDILADEGDNQARKTKSAAAKANDDLTPKERAAAKAVQDAERKAKREAEKAKKAEEAAKEAARKKALENFDDSGFSQQRHQRMKETRLQERAPVESKKDKAATEEKGEVKAKGEKKQFKGDKKPFKGDKGPKGDKPAKVNKGEGNHEGRAPRREFDRHSQGVTSRQANSKKQGQGKGNWGGAVPTGLNTDVQHALASEELAAPAETEGWGEAPVQSEAATEVAEVPAEGAEVVEGEEPVVEEEEEKQVTLEEYQLIQAEKKKALEALVGSAQPRELTEDEKKAVAKFTLVENEKAKKPKAAQAKPVTVVTPGARKGEKAVALDAYVQIRVAGPRTDRPRGRGGRFEGQREGQRGGNNQRKGGRGAAPQKIPKGKDAFPTLG